MYPGVQRERFDRDALGLAYPADGAAEGGVGRRARGLGVLWGARARRLVSHGLGGDLVEVGGGTCHEHEAAGGAVDQAGAVERVDGVGDIDGPADFAGQLLG